MKTLKILFVTMFFCSFTNAQTIIVNYEEKNIISAERLEKMPEYAREKYTEVFNYELIYSNSKSIYKSIESKNDNITTENQKITEKQTEDLIEKNIIITKITNKKSEKLIYVDHLKKEMLFVWPSGSDNMFGKDSLQKWKWNITDDIKAIDGFVCRKATSNWLGYDFTAWYTDEISINIGPEKFEGLPGLILYVYSPNFEWKAVRISQTDNDTEIVSPNFDGKKTNTLSEINDIFINKMKNYTPTKTITQDGNTTITREKIIIK
ncbi:GLPGLI family protein [Flavobacterium gelidilacus]|uniref:GLPGLI family protein n=1 Tax=Flavobacterium gelidilacus TaxID=206041 RepID=UPI0004199E24|nr:GLPGLI family protein [Flavobacterium gelidilacus]